MRLDSYDIDYNIQELITSENSANYIAYDNADIEAMSINDIIPPEELQEETIYQVSLQLQHYTTDESFSLDEGNVNEDSLITINSLVHNNIDLVSDGSWNYNLQDFIDGENEAITFYNSEDTLDTYNKLVSDKIVLKTISISPNRTKIEDSKINFELDPQIVNYEYSASEVEDEAQNLNIDTSQLYSTADYKINYEIIPSEAAETFYWDNEINSATNFEDIITLDKENQIQEKILTYSLLENDIYFEHIVLTPSDTATDYTPYIKELSFISGVEIEDKDTIKVDWNKLSIECETEYLSNLLSISGGYIYYIDPENPTENPIGELVLNIKDKTLTIVEKENMEIEKTIPRFDIIVNKENFITLTRVESYYEEETDFYSNGYIYRFSENPSYDNVFTKIQFEDETVDYYYLNLIEEQTLNIDKNIKAWRYTLNNVEKYRISNGTVQEKRIINNTQQPTIELNGSIVMTDKLYKKEDIEAFQIRYNKNYIYSGEIKFEFILQNVFNLEVNKDEVIEQLSNSTINTQIKIGSVKLTKYSQLTDIQQYTSDTLPYKFVLHPCDEEGYEPETGINFDLTKYYYKYFNVYIEKQGDVTDITFPYYVVSSYGDNRTGLTITVLDEYIDNDMEGNYDTDGVNYKIDIVIAFLEKNVVEGKVNFFRGPAIDDVASVVLDGGVYFQYFDKEETNDKVIPPRGLITLGNEMDATNDTVEAVQMCAPFYYDPITKEFYLDCGTITTEEQQLEEELENEDIIFDEEE